MFFYIRLSCYRTISILQALLSLCVLVLSMLLKSILKYASLSLSRDVDRRGIWGLAVYTSYKSSLYREEVARLIVRCSFMKAHRLATKQSLSNLKEFQRRLRHEPIDIHGANDHFALRARERSLTLTGDLLSRRRSGIASLWHLKVSMASHEFQDLLVLNGN